MRLLIVTQDDSIFLPEIITKLLSDLPKHHMVVGAVCSGTNPFGKKSNFFTKAIKTLQVFGMHFFIDYSLKFLIRKFFKRLSVRKVFEQAGIPILDLATSINDQSSLHTISGTRPDLIISIAGSEIFKRKLIDVPTYGCLNIHTSLLPKYRGLMPSFWVLLNNEQETGVSVFYIDEGIDSGPIIKQQNVNIENMTQKELIKATKYIGIDLLIEAIEDIESNNVTLVSNDDSDATYYSFPTREDVKAFIRSGKKF